MSADDENKYFASLSEERRRKFQEMKIHPSSAEEAAMLDRAAERNAAYRPGAQKKREQPTPGQPHKLTKEEIERGKSFFRTEAARRNEETFRKVKGTGGHTVGGLGAQLLGAGKNWLENAGANLRGDTPPHRAKTRAGRFLENASRNVSRMDLSVNPFGNPMAGLGLGLPSNPAPLPPMWGMGEGGPIRRPSGKKGKKGKKPREPESRPWDPNHIPPGARDFF